MLKVFYAPKTRGFRVIWLCNELNIPLEVEHIDFSVEWRARPEWRAISPLGKVPILHDGEVKIFESVAMMEYVLARYGQGALQFPAATAEHAEYLQWIWFAEATFARPLGNIVNHSREFPGEQRIDAVVAEMQNRAIAAGEMVADYMQGRKYLVADTFSAADIAMGYTIMLLDAFVGDRFPPGLKEYWQRLSSRPAFVEASQH